MDEISINLWGQTRTIKQGHFLKSQCMSLKKRGRRGGTKLMEGCLFKFWPGGGVPFREEWVQELTKAIVLFGQENLKKRKQAPDYLCYHFCSIPFWTSDYWNSACRNKETVWSFPGWRQQKQKLPCLSHGKILTSILHSIRTWNSTEIRQFTKLEHFLKFTNIN